MYIDIGIYQVIGVKMIFVGAFVAALSCLYVYAGAFFYGGILIVRPLLALLAFLAFLAFLSLFALLAQRSLDCS